MRKVRGSRKDQRVNVRSKGHGNCRGSKEGQRVMGKVRRSMEGKRIKRRSED